MAQFHVAGYSLGARVALELATRGRTLSVIAISPDGLGTPLERVHQAAALLSGPTLARLLAPIASPVAATGARRSLFFAMERSRPWQLPADDAGQLLLDFAQAPAYLETVQVSMVDVPMRLERITCPVLLLQGTADQLVSMQSPRFLAFVRHAQLQWLPSLSHVPISDDPRLVASIMLRFLKTATREKEHGDRLDAGQPPGGSGLTVSSVLVAEGELATSPWGPVLGGSRPRAACRLAGSAPVGYAELVEAVVEQLELPDLEDPLAYLHGRYRSVDDFPDHG